MENRIMILFFMLLSLFLLFSAASALLTVLRRKWCRRLPSVVWSVLFLLPLLPLSLSGSHCPAQIEMTLAADGSRVISVLPAETEIQALLPSLTPAEDGTIRLSQLPRELPKAALPDGLHISKELWSALNYITAFSLFLWITLALAHLTHRICAYAESIRYLTSRSSVCHDERLCEVFRLSALQVKLHRKPQLRIVEPGIHLSPCTSGFFTPTVYISHTQSRMASDELEYIFLHELCHVKRHDFFLKVLALIATSVHFPAPFAGEVRRQVYEDCELGCDRMVLSFIGSARCSRYMQTILAIAEQKSQGRIIRGELFSYASATKELLLRRYRNLITDEKPVDLKGGLQLSSALLMVFLLHLCLFSSLDTAPLANPMIRFSSPYLETVIREYYNLRDDAPVTMEHLDGIWSLEFSFSRKAEKVRSQSGGDTLALCCTINEGKYYVQTDLSGEEWTIMLEQGGLADGISPDLQYRMESRIPVPASGDEPLWMDLRYDCAVDLLPDVCPLPVLERYLPKDENACLELLSRYTCLDGTEETLEQYAQKIYMTVIRENSLDVNAPESEITAAFERYCTANGIAFDPSKSDILSQLRDHRRGEIFALSPAALSSPMAFLDPTLTETEREALLDMLESDGKLGSKCLSGMIPDTTGRYAMDLADLVLFANLRTVILNDRLAMADKTALTESWCAVIER